MHDPKSFLSNHFNQEHMKTAYAHHVDPDDSIYQGAKEFQKILTKISSPYEKNFIFQYHKELNTKVLHYRRLELSLGENAQKQLVEKGAQKPKPITSSI